MIPVRSIGPAPSLEALSSALPSLPRERHGKCFWIRATENVSLPVAGSVNFFRSAAKPNSRERDRSSMRMGSIHRASRNGHRERTCVRAACGGAIRPQGVGVLPSHGHCGRSFVRREPLPHVVRDRVLQPAGEPSCRCRPFSRGPRLPAATLTPPLVRSSRMSAAADRTVPATRRRSPAVIRATSLPGTSAGMSGGWRRRTTPGPCTRLHGA